MKNNLANEKSVNGKSLRVAIVHDWLVGGGAEKVVLELHKMYPEAPIYTSYCTDEWREKLDGKVVTGYLQHLGKIRKFLPPLRALWFSRLDLSEYDLVISSTGNGEAKFILPKPSSTFHLPSSEPVHICYCNTPTHFYWRHYSHYLKEPGFGVFNPLARLGLRLLVGPMRKWDLKASKRPDHYIANSTHIQNDIKKYYNRESTVIFPPVDTARFSHLPSSTFHLPARKGYVTVGRLVPNKRVDILVEACTKLGLPLTVIGRGPDLERLKSLAGSTIKFDTNASDEAVVNYMATAEAFLFASFEDFGIAPVEAMAAGTPVIAYKAGGALDYVIPGKTGEFFEKQAVESLVKALEGFSPNRYSAVKVNLAANEFSIENFHKNFGNYVKSVLVKLSKS